MKPPLHALLIAAGLVAVDQLTKLWAGASLSHPVVIIPSCFRLTLSHNPGALFGFASGLSQPWRGLLLTLLPALAVGVIVYLLGKTKPREAFARVGLALILGGAVGNLIDRLLYGFVIDFLDFYASWPWISDRLVSWFGTNRWPTFNVADIGLTSGGALLVYELFLRRRDGVPDASLSD